MVNISISHKEAGRRLDRYLQMLLPGAGLSFLCKMIRKKNITVNDRKAEPSLKLNEGDSIKIYFSDETFSKFADSQHGSAEISSEPEESSPCDTGLYSDAYNELGNISIVYEDDDFIFIDKPVGVLSQQAGAGDFSVNEWLVGHCLKNGELKPEELRTFKPAFANRLDRNTSGLMPGGKTLSALRFLNHVIKEGRVDKYYLCLAQGCPDESFDVKRDEEMELSGYLTKDETHNKSDIIIPRGKACEDALHGSFGLAAQDGSAIRTGFRLLEQYDDAMLIEAHLHTGKSHQIRATLSYIGHPILGDVKYGGVAKSGNIGFGHVQLLHSYRIVFGDAEGYPRVAHREFKTEIPSWLGSVRSKKNTVR